ncbi:hypothetical protein SDC9_41253 [bioreactor metagenome]|uniref:Phage tail tape measure protein domain-containing protein n=1 Tax=bioreactor metagenome TaxID=1076179 RepID=A0A644VV41_9ZZZZ
MADKPDIKLLIGALGGSSSSGQSAALIRRQLQNAFKDGLKIKIKLDDVDIGSIKARISEQQKGISASQTELNINKQLEKSFERAAAIAKKTQRTDELKQSAAINKNLEKEYQLKLKNQSAQEQVSQSYWDGRFKENLKDMTATNDELLKMRTYYAELEKSTAAYATQQDKATATAIKVSEQTAKTSAQATSGLSNFNAYLRTVDPKVLGQFADDIERIRSLFASAVGGSGEALTKANNQIKILQSNFKNLGAEGGNAFTYLQGKIKTFMVYLASSAITIGVVNGIRNAVSAVYDLDKALTNLRIVTSGSNESAKELLLTYNQMAQSLGSTTTAVAESAVEWQRQGYDLADTNTLIKDSMVLSIVGMVDSTEAAQYLTSAIKGYKTEVSEAIDIVDKLTAVDVKAAVSAGGLAEAMARTANSARLAGVDMNTLIGYMATVGEVTQRDMSTVGEAFKTIFARYSNVKLGSLVDEESGESLNDFETALKLVGISLRDTYGQFRDFNEVIQEVGENYDTFSSVEKSAIATTLGGVRQRENVLVLFENLDKAMGYAETAATSAGTAMEKFGAYEESLEAKQNRLTSAFDKFSRSLIDSGLIGGILDFQTAVLNLSAEIPDVAKNAVALSVSLLAVVVALKAIAASTIGVSLANTVSSITSAFVGLYALLRDLPMVLASVTSGTLSLGNALAFLNINPVFLGLTALSVAIFGIVKAYDYFNVSAEEHAENLSNLSSEYDSLKSSISSLQSELATTQDRIEELHQLQQDGTISLVEQDEYDRLVKTNEQLERQLKVQESLANIKQQDLEKEAKSSLTDKSYYDTTFGNEHYGSSFWGSAGSSINLQTAAENYGRAVEVIDQKIADLNKQFDDGAISEAEYSESYEKLSQTRTDALTAYVGIIEQLQTAISKLDGDTPEEQALIQFVNSLVDQYFQLSGQSDNLADVSGNLSDSMNDTATSLDKFSQAVSDHNTKLQTLKDGYDAITDAVSDYGDQLFISKDALNALEVVIPGVTSLLYDENGALTEAAAAALASTDGFLKFLSAQKAVQYNSDKTNYQNQIDQLTALATAASAAGDRLIALMIMQDVEKAKKSLSNLESSYAGFLNLLDYSKNVQSHTSSSKTVENYVADIEKFRDALKRVEDIANDISTTQAKMDLVDESDVEALEVYTDRLVSLYKEQQSALHALNNERDTAIESGVDQLRSLGFSIEYDSGDNSLFIKNLELLNQLGSNLDTESAIEYRKEIEDLINNITDWNQENIDGSLEWLQIQKQINDLLTDSQERKLNLLREQKENLSDIIDLTKALIEKEQNDLIDALNEEVDAYSEIISLKKKSLELTKEENSYQDSVDSLNSNIGKLQAQIDILALDDSREAQARRASLLEELAEKQKDLADTQADYSLSAQEDALDEELDSFEKTQDAKINEIKKFLDNNQALTKAAMDRIDKQGDALFDDLLSYALHYTQTTEAELVSMWDAAKNAVNEYGSAIRAVNSINGQIDVIENGSSASTSSVKAIVAQMKANSTAWASASDSGKVKLESQNKTLGGSIGATIDQNGVWWLNGERLYDVYHSGTQSAGQLPTPKQNELWALIEKGEAILTQKQQSGVLGMIQGLASKLNIANGISAISASVSNSAPSVQPVRVDASITIQGAVSLDDEMKSFIKRYPKLVAEEVNKVLGTA